MNRPQLTRRLVLSTLTATAVLLGSGHAQAEKGKHEGRGKAKIERICEELACSDDQREAIAEIFKQLHLDIKPEHEAIRELRRELAAEWKRARPDERALAKIADKIAAHERNIADRRMEAMLELHPLLSPAQREKLADHLMKGPRHPPR